MQLNFDATNVAPSSAPIPLETGWYPSNIIATEEKPTKNGQGAYLEIKFRISTGTNKVMTSRLNLKNNNPQAVEIAYGELSAICHAVGKLRVQHAAELHGGPLEIYVKKVPRTDSPGNFSNDVAGYRAIGATGSQPGFAGAAGTQVTAAPNWAAPAPAAPAYAPAPVPAGVQPTWAAPAAAAPAPQYAPPPAQPAASAAPAGATSVPPWAR